MSGENGLCFTECLCMGKKDPIGIDTVPLLSWKCRSGRNGDGQRAWRVRILRILPEGGKEEVWDTGMVEGGQNLFREERLSLRPRTVFGDRQTGGGLEGEMDLYNTLPKGCRCKRGLLVQNRGHAPGEGGQGQTVRLRRGAV